MAIQRNIFQNWSDEMAYALGFIYADGCLFKNPRGSEYLEIVSADSEIIRKLKKIITSDNKVGVQTRHQKQSAYRLQIGSQEMMQSLKGFGLTPRKSKTISFPTIPSPYLRHFIRGYFDGDGCVSFGTYPRKGRKDFSFHCTVRFTSGSKKFLEGLWSALKAIAAGGYLYKKTGCFELVFARRDGLAISDFMYHNVSSCSYLMRKRAIFREIELRA